MELQKIYDICKDVIKEDESLINKMFIYFSRKYTTLSYGRISSFINMNRGLAWNNNKFIEESIDRIILKYKNKIDLEICNKDKIKETVLSNPNFIKELINLIVKYL